MFFRTLKKVNSTLYGLTVLTNRSINSWNNLFAISHYDVLGVSTTASKNEIRKAYLQKAKELHPDNNLNDDSLHERFTQVTQAYQILADDDLRNSYNINPHHSSSDVNTQGNRKTRQHSTSSTNPFGQYDEAWWEWDESTKRKMYDDFYSTTYPDYLKQVNEDWNNRRRKNRLYVLLILTVALSVGVLNISTIWVYHQDYQKRSDKINAENAAFLNNRKTGYRAYINRMTETNVQQNKRDPPP